MNAVPALLVAPGVHVPALPSAHGPRHYHAVQRCRHSELGPWSSWSARRYRTLLRSEPPPVLGRTTDNPCAAWRLAKLLQDCQSRAELSLVSLGPLSRAVKVADHLRPWSKVLDLVRYASTADAMARLERRLATSAALPEGVVSRVLMYVPIDQGWALVAATVPGQVVEAGEWTSHVNLALIRHAPLVAKWSLRRAVSAVEAAWQLKTCLELPAVFHSSEAADATRPHENVGCDTEGPDADHLNLRAAPRSWGQCE